MSIVLGEQPEQAKVEGETDSETDCETDSETDRSLHSTIRRFYILQKKMGGGWNGGLARITCCKRWRG